MHRRWFAGHFEVFASTAGWLLSVTLEMSLTTVQTRLPRACSPHDVPASVFCGSFEVEVTDEILDSGGGKKVTPMKPMAYSEADVGGVKHSEYHVLYAMLGRVDIVFLGFYYLPTGASSHSLPPALDL